MTEAAPSLAAFARAADYDRYLCAVFAPARYREALFALIAFNHEVARIPEIVTEPMLGRIRVQWWREVIDAVYADAAIRKHEVTLPLADTIRRHKLDRAPFDKILDARDRDLEDPPPADMAALLRYVLDTSGAVCAQMVAVLGGRDEAAQAAAADVGAAWGLVGTLRAVAFHAAGNRLYLPGDLLRSAGLTPERIVSGEVLGDLRPVGEAIAGEAAKHLMAARARRRDVPRTARVGLLLAPLAEMYLARLRQARFDPRDPRLAMSPLRRQLTLARDRMLGRY